MTTRKKIERLFRAAALAVLTVLPSAAAADEVARVRPFSIADFPPLIQSATRYAHIDKCLGGLRRVADGLTRWTVSVYPTGRFKCDAGSNLIRRGFEPKETFFYFGSPDLPRNSIEPYTLFTLLRGTYHSKCHWTFEGKKFEFQIYSLLDAGCTNIQSNACFIRGTSDNCHEGRLFMKMDKLEKPTEEDWKTLKMDFLFMTLFDWKINGKLTTKPKRK